MSVFFAGTKEGARDIKIYQSFLNKNENGSWSTPRPILSANELSQLSGKFIKKLGNPIIFKDTNNKIHLFVVGVSFGGWSASKIYQLSFNENLDRLHYVDELHLGVISNLSHLVRTPALALENGGFMLPLYHELADKYPIVVFFDSNGSFLFHRRINTLKSQLQPTIIPLNNNECLAFFRIHREYDNNAFLQKCSANGNIWDNPYQSNIKNFDSSSLLIKINNEIFLLHNDGMNNQKVAEIKSNSDEIHIHPRTSLSLFWLKDIENGIFEYINTIDISKNGEISYPAAIVDTKYMHITYTLDRKNIKYQRIDIHSILNKINQNKGDEV